MKKFEQLGKCLSKEEQKKIMGSDGGKDGGIGGGDYCDTRNCNSPDDCSGNACYNCGSPIGGLWGTCERG